MRKLIFVCFYLWQIPEWICLGSNVVRTIFIFKIKIQREECAARACSSLGGVKKKRGKKKMMKRRDSEMI